MKYCIKCLQPDTRPGTKFSKEGLCPACIYNKNKNYWHEKEPNVWNFRGLSSYLKKTKDPRIIKKDSKFICNSDINLGKKENHITFGKGYSN